MQANPFLILIILLIGSTGSGLASVRDVTELSSELSSKKTLNPASLNASSHPNQVTYPLPTRKAKLDDESGSDDIASQSSSGSSNNNNISLTSPIAKAATDISSSSSNNTTKSSCDKPPRPHSGISLKPSLKTYPIGSYVIYQCHNEISTTAHCEAGGSWSRGPPHCPPTNQSCPDISDLANGVVNYTHTPSANPRPLRSQAIVRCNPGYELLGAPRMTCDVGFKWSFKRPICSLIKQEPSSSRSFLTVLLFSIGVLLTLIALISVSLWYRWWRRKMQRERWQTLFVSYQYPTRQSKRKFAQIHNNSSTAQQEMKQFKATAAAIPSTEL